jgi:hypothetical protein
VGENLELRAAIGMRMDATRTLALSFILLELSAFGTLTHTTT